MKKWTGHLLTSFSITVWAVTFISTKVLLDSFSTVEIIFCRFIIAIAVLFLIKPRLLRFTNLKHELYFAVAGITGVSLYFVFETLALTYTQASNVSIIVSMAPVFTVFFAWIADRNEKPSVPFFIGFIISITGIVLISINGLQSLQLNPRGDLLALLCAAVWGVYSVVVQRINRFGYDLIQTTRRIFIYGLIFLLPVFFFMDFSIDLSLVADPVNLMNLLFLGVIASGLCFLSWNKSVEILGPVKTSVYIYLQPLLTIVFSILILDEKFTVVSVVGSLLITAGLIISQRFHGRR